MDMNFSEQWNFPPTECATHTGNIPNGPNPHLSPLQPKRIEFSVRIIEVPFIFRILSKRHTLTIVNPPLSSQDKPQNLFIYFSLIGEKKRQLDEYVLVFYSIIAINW